MATFYYYFFFLGGGVEGEIMLYVTMAFRLIHHSNTFPEGNIKKKLFFLHPHTVLSGDATTQQFAFWTSFAGSPKYCKFIFK